MSGHTAGREANTGRRNRRVTAGNAIPRPSSPFTFGVPRR